MAVALVSVFVCSVVGCAVAVGVLVSTKKKLALERAEAAAFRERFPPTLLDVDTEVKRLGALRASLERDISDARTSAEAEEARARAKAAATKAGIEEEHAKLRADWERKFSLAVVELQTLQREVEGLNEEAEIQSFGLYKPRYDFTKAADYKEEIDSIREKQKRMLSEKTAAVCFTKWQVGGSSAEGKRMTDRQLKLMLRAFNGECDGATASVTWKNVVTIRERVRKSLEAINKLGETVQCEIQQEYLQLKIKELDLAFEYAEKVQAEKEEQRQLREQMREEEKAAKEMEREKDEAQREEDRYEKALVKARAEMAKANQGERQEIDAKIAKLEALLATAEERKQRAISQAEMTRLGHVYVLSNEGSFGPNVFKVGMTRRLDPQERVDELGDASVPFRFDVHAIIRSDDAPGLELKLQEALEPHRINLVNRRKEYFRVPIEKIADLVAKHHGKVELTRLAEAAEFRKSLAVRAEREAMVFGKDAHASAVTRADQVKARFEELKKVTS